MKYKKFIIRNYRAIKGPLKIELKDKRIMPIVGINECGKTTILQAVYCFDYTNDREYKGKHLENFNNLYETSNDEAFVEAEVDCTYEEIEKIIEDFIYSINKKEILKSNGQAYKRITKESFYKEIGKVKFNDRILISRDLNTKTYKIDYFNKIDDELQNMIAKYIIERELPYILYNDDFTDRPPNEIVIPEDREEELIDWLAIYERVFNMSPAKCSLFDVVEEKDNRFQRSALSDVSSYLNEKLLEDWEKFSVDNNKLEIELSIENRILNIQIVENIAGKRRYFNVGDRSKGFLWFYNFIMKIRFNAKATVRNSVITDTIFLLDEPGSYLHLNAQDKLCSNLRRISEEDGVVIYCTHSHHLLNPEYIPCNTINITEKKDKKLVQLTPINKYPTRMEKKNTLQPVYEALGLSPYDVIKDNNKVICVEGIYDKYVLELFCNLPTNSIVFPGNSADSIVKNIQYFIAYSKNYIAIWDNDDEGKKQYDVACKCYGEESKRFDLLPKGEKSKRRMEDMFVSQDLESIKEIVGIEGNANYENIILAAYYYQKRKEIKKCLSEQTISNFEILDKIIEKRFLRK